jgi:hypothetical protein
VPATNTPVPPTNTPAAATSTPTPCSISFSDVLPTDYFYQGVTYLYCHGAISGYADGTFRPYNDVTRGQMVKIITLAFGVPLFTPTSPTFTDVPTSHPFYVYVETAAHAGIVSGYADGTFRPQNNVTRGQISKIIALAAGWPLVNPPVGTFEDVAPGSAFYTYVETIAMRNVISGYTCGGPGEPCGNPARPYFRQNANATRGQIAKVVYGALSNPLAAGSGKK